MAQTPNLESSLGRELAAALAELPGVVVENHMAEGDLGTGRRADLILEARIRGQPGDEVVVGIDPDGIVGRRLG